MSLAVIGPDLCANELHFSESLMFQGSLPAYVQVALLPEPGRVTVSETRSPSVADGGVMHIILERMCSTAEEFCSPCSKPARRYALKKHAAGPIH